ncbi:hypothetical protein HanRHA438_Chr02g0080501 [Helianthus annuus]|nr:hypothetical protein HanRHA438_Chr02g0080501 [Helianthus annuus]
MVDVVFWSSHFTSIYIYFRLCLVYFLVFLYFFAIPVSWIFEFCRSPYPSPVTVSVLHS